MAYNSAGRAVGLFERDPDGLVWLEKRGLDPAAHQLRTPAAWCTDQHHLDELRRRGGAGVRLYTTTAEVWSASLAAFDRHGIPIDRGCGRQVALPLRYWRVERPGAPRQLALFEAAS